MKKLAAKVAGRLQKEQLYARTVSVMVKTSGFQRRSIQERLADSTCREDVIYETARRLAGKLLLGKGKASGRGLLHEVPGIRLVGVGTSDLDHGRYRQMTLMDLMEMSEEAVSTAAPEKESIKEKKREALEAMTMAIRGRYGADAIRKGPKAGK